MSSATEQLASMAQELQSLMARFKITDTASDNEPRPAHEPDGGHGGSGNGTTKGTGNEAGNGKSAETRHLSLLKTTS
jgi:hypothetical protein